MSFYSEVRQGEVEPRSGSGLMRDTLGNLDPIGHVVEACGVPGFVTKGKSMPSEIVGSLFKRRATATPALRLVKIRKGEFKNSMLAQRLAAANDSAGSNDAAKEAAIIKEFKVIGVDIVFEGACPKHGNPAAASGGDTDRAHRPVQGFSRG